MNKLLFKLVMGMSFLMAVPSAAAEENKWVEVQGGAWHVSAATLKEVKAGIVPFVETANDPETESSQKNIKDLKTHWKGYTVQYRGQRRNGRDLIFMQALCRGGTGRSLRKSFLRVYDGGACYFSLAYDPAEKKFSDLWINGDG
jgi:hypothetical protein